MVASGLPEPNDEHAQAIADFALLAAAASRMVLSPVSGAPINIRIGIHSGGCAAGVVGTLMPR